MDFNYALGLLISGGIIGALGTLGGALLQMRGEADRARMRRVQELSDRQYNLKREAYLEALKEFNFSALTYGSGDRELTMEETLRRNSAMTLFDMHAPDHVKALAARVMHIFQMDIPDVGGAKEAYRRDLINEMRALSESIRKDLEN